MYIEKYFEYTRDKKMSTELVEGNIFCTKTKYGNTLYWNGETGKVVKALWKVPGIDRIDIMSEKDLEEISGEYWLRSYGEKL